MHHLDLANPKGCEYAKNIPHKVCVCRLHLMDALVCLQ